MADIPALLQEIEALQAQAGPGASKEERIAAVTRVEHLLMGNCSQIIEYFRQLEAEREASRKALRESIDLSFRIHAETKAVFAQFEKIQQLMVEATKGLSLAELIELNQKISDVRAGHA